MYGTEAIKKVAKGVITLGDIVSDVKEDGKINLADIGQIMRLPSVIDSFKDLDEVAKEYLDMNDAEADEIRQYIIAELAQVSDDNEADDIEQAVAQVLNAIVALGNVISLVKGIKFN